MKKEDILKQITVKQEVITLETLNNVQVTIKEPNINESMALEKLRKKVVAKEATDNDLIIETCRVVMVEPEFFTDEELSNISQIGMNMMAEIYMKVPTIGMTEEEKVAYEKRLIDSINNQVNKILTQEEEEKKHEKKKDSSLN